MEKQNRFRRILDLEIYAPESKSRDIKKQTREIYLGSKETLDQISDSALLREVQERKRRKQMSSSLMMRQVEEDVKKLEPMMEKVNRALGEDDVESADLRRLRDRVQRNGERNDRSNDTIQKSGVDPVEEKNRDQMDREPTPDKKTQLERSREQNSRNDQDQRPIPNNRNSQDKNLRVRGIEDFAKFYMKTPHEYDTETRDTLVEIGELEREKLIRLEQLKIKEKQNFFVKKWERSKSPTRNDLLNRHHERNIFWKNRNAPGQKGTVYVPQGSNLRNFAPQDRAYVPYRPNSYQYQFDYPGSRHRASNKEQNKNDQDDSLINIKDAHDSQTNPESRNDPTTPSNKKSQSQKSRQSDHLQVPPSPPEPKSFIDARNKQKKKSVTFDLKSNQVIELGPSQQKDTVEERKIHLDQTNGLLLFYEDDNLARRLSRRATKEFAGDWRDLEKRGEEIMEMSLLGDLMDKERQFDFDEGGTIKVTQQELEQNANSKIEWLKNYKNQGLVEKVGDDEWQMKPVFWALKEREAIEQQKITEAQSENDKEDESQKNEQISDTNDKNPKPTKQDHQRRNRAKTKSERSHGQMSVTWSDFRRLHTSILTRDSKRNYIDRKSEYIQDWKHLLKGSDFAVINKFSGEKADPSKFFGDWKQMEDENLVILDRKRAGTMRPSLYFSDWQRLERDEGIEFINEKGKPVDGLARYGGDLRAMENDGVKLWQKRTGAVLRPSRYFENMRRFEVEVEKKRRESENQRKSTGGLGRSQQVQNGRSRIASKWGDVRDLVHLENRLKGKGSGGDKGRFVSMNGKEWYILERDEHDKDKQTQIDKRDQRNRLQTMKQDDWEMLYGTKDGKQGNNKSKSDPNRNRVITLTGEEWLKMEGQQSKPTQNPPNTSNRSRMVTLFDQDWMLLEGNYPVQGERKFLMRKIDGDEMFVMGYQDIQKIITEDLQKSQISRPQNRSSNEKIVRFNDGSVKRMTGLSNNTNVSGNFVDFNKLMANQDQDRRRSFYPRSFVNQMENEMRDGKIRSFLDVDGGSMGFNRTSRTGKSFYAPDLLQGTRDTRMRGRMETQYAADLYQIDEGQGGSEGRPSGLNVPGGSIRDPGHNGGRGNTMFAPDIFRDYNNSLKRNQSMYSPDMSSWEDPRDQRNKSMYAPDLFRHHDQRGRNPTQYAPDLYKNDDQRGRNPTQYAPDLYKDNDQRGRNPTQYAPNLYRNDKERNRNPTQYTPDMYRQLNKNDRSQSMYAPDLYRHFSPESNRGRMATQYAPDLFQNSQDGRQKSNTEYASDLFRNSNSQNNRNRNETEYAPDQSRDFNNNPSRAKSQNHFAPDLFGDHERKRNQTHYAPDLFKNLNRERQPTEYAPDLYPNQESGGEQANDPAKDRKRQNTVYAPDLFRDGDQSRQGRKRNETQYAPDVYPPSTQSGRDRHETQYAPDLLNLNSEERRKRLQTLYAPDLVNIDPEERKRLLTQYAPDLLDLDAEERRKRLLTQYAPDLLNLDPAERRKRLQTLYSPDLFKEDPNNQHHKSFYAKDFERLWGKQPKDPKNRSMDQIGEGLRNWEIRQMEGQNGPRSKHNSLGGRKSISDKDFYNMMFGYPQEKTQQGESTDQIRKPATSMYAGDWKQMEHGATPTQKEKELIASRYFGDFMNMLNEEKGPRDRRISMHPSMLQFMDENPQWTNRMISNWRESVIAKQNKITPNDQEQNNDSQDQTSLNNPNQLDPNKKNSNAGQTFPRTMSFSHRDDENTQWEDSGENEGNLNNLISNLQSNKQGKDKKGENNIFKNKESGLRNKDQGKDPEGRRIRNNTAITPTQPIFNLSGVEDLGNSRADSSTDSLRKLDEYNRKLEKFNQMTNSIPAREFRSEADQMLLRNKNTGIPLNKYQSDKISQIYRRIQSLRAEDQEASKQFSEQGSQHESTPQQDHTNPSHSRNFEKKPAPQTNLIDATDNETHFQSKNFHKKIEKSILELDSPEVENQKDKIKIIEKFIVSNDLGLFLQSVVLSPDDNKFIIKMNSGEENEKSNLEVSAGNTRPHRLSKRERNFTKKYEIIAIDEDNREHIEETIRRNGEELGNSGFLNTNKIQIEDPDRPNNIREYFIQPNNIRDLEQEEIYIIRHPPTLDADKLDSNSPSPQLRPSRLISQYDFVIDRTKLEKSELVDESGVEFDSKKSPKPIKETNEDQNQPDNLEVPSTGGTKINDLLRPNPNNEVIKKYIAISYVQPLVSPTESKNQFGSKNKRNSERNSRNENAPEIGLETRPQNAGSFLKDIEISGVNEEQYWKRKQRINSDRDHQFSMPTSEQTKIFNRGENNTNVEQMGSDEMSQDTRPFNGKLSSPVTSNRSMYHKACKSKGNPKPKIDNGFYSPRKQLSRPLSYVHPDNNRSRISGPTHGRKQSPKSTRTVARKDNTTKAKTMLSDIPDQESYDMRETQEDRNRLANTSPLPVRSKSKHKSKQDTTKPKRKRKPKLEDREKKYTIRMPKTTNLKSKNNKFGTSRSPSRSRSRPKKKANQGHAHRFKQKFIDKNADFYVKSKVKLENRNLSPHSFWNLEKGPFMSKLLKNKNMKFNEQSQIENPSEKKKNVKIKENSRQKSVELQKADYEINCEQRDYYTKRYYQKKLISEKESLHYKPSQIRGILPGLMSPSNRTVQQPVPVKSDFDIRRKEFSRNQKMNRNGETVRDLISGRSPNTLQSTHRDRSRSADIQDENQFCNLCDDHFHPKCFDDYYRKVKK